MPEQEFREFIREVTDRLARIETKLEAWRTGRTMELEACRVKHDGELEDLRSEVEELKEEKKWLWRTVIGTLIAFILETLFRGWKG